MSCHSAEQYNDPPEREDSEGAADIKAKDRPSIDLVAAERGSKKGKSTEYKEEFDAVAPRIYETLDGAKVKATWAGIASREASMNERHKQNGQPTEAIDERVIAFFFDDRRR